MRARAFARSRARICALTRAQVNTARVRAQPKRERPSMIVASSSVSHVPMILAAPAPAPLVTEELPYAMLPSLGEMLMPPRRALAPVFLDTELIGISAAGFC